MLHEFLSQNRRSVLALSRIKTAVIAESKPTSKILEKGLLEENPEEVRALHDDLLIHVTHFYREPKSLAMLRAKSFPRILKALPADVPIRVWVPGCSSGEEAYTLAIELFDFLSERDSMNQIQIFATDISDVSLERARAGVYSGDIVHHVAPRLLRRFFTKVDRGYEIIKRVRDACVFARQDLTKDPPFANLDLISCRNVLIYLAPAAQKQIFPMFHYALRPSGTLILGNSETVGEFGEFFSLVDKKCRLYYKVPSSEPHRFFGRAQPAATRTVDVPAVEKIAAGTHWPDADIQKVAERILLSRFAPAGVVVSGSLEILHFRGHISGFLEPGTGRANLSLLKMLPAHAGEMMKSLIGKARKSDSTVKRGGVELYNDDGSRTKNISIEVIPFRLPLSGDRYFIILFEDEPSRPPGSKSYRVMSAKKAAPEGPRGASVQRLRSELASTRNYLQTISEEHEAVNEELKAANEEILSSNEELQSTNEELEIAKEELQAANEELSTVNEELQTRNGDLGQLNNDLLNLISSVHLPIVMVSSDLRIRRFSAMAEKVMNLIPGDIGRPIGDIKLKISLPNIEEIIHEVIEAVAAKELDVRDSEGHSYAVRVLPYKTTDNKIEGAVIVFMDNDPILRSTHGLKEASAFEAVLEMGQEPLAVLDGRMRIQACSRSMYQAFGLTRSSMGLSLFEIEGGRWNLPKLRAHLELLAAQDKPFSKIPIQAANRKLIFSARGIKSSSGGPPLILLSINPSPPPPRGTTRRGDAGLKLSARSRIL